MIACQLVVHCRLQADMGILQKSEFDAIVQKKAMQLPFLPGPGSEAVLLKTGYEAHKARQRPPAQAMPAEVPKSWAWAEKCRVEEARLLPVSAGLCLLLALEAVLPLLLVQTGALCE